LQNGSLELQYKLEKIIFDFSLPMMENDDLRMAIPVRQQKLCEEHIKEVLRSGAAIEKTEIQKKLNEHSKNNEILLDEEMTPVNTDQPPQPQVAEK
jgi:hypothetical protein